MLGKSKTGSAPMQHDWVTCVRYLSQTIFPQRYEPTSFRLTDRTPGRSSQIEFQVGSQVGFPQVPKSTMLQCGLVLHAGGFFCQVCASLNTIQCVRPDNAVLICALRKLRDDFLQVGFLQVTQNITHCVRGLGAEQQIPI